MAASGMKPADIAAALGISWPSAAKYMSDEERRHRPAPLTPKQHAQVLKRRKQGATLKQIADELGMHTATIGRWALKPQASSRKK